MTMIRMLPAAGTSAYSEVNALIDSNKQTLVQVTLTLRNGTKQLIEISDYDASHNYSDREFRFDKTRYPHVEIIDLR
jgi:outer membrane lipoprotein-sorting protein